MSLVHVVRTSNIRGDLGHHCGLYTDEQTARQICDEAVKEFIGRYEGAHAVDNKPHDGAVYTVTVQFGNAREVCPANVYFSVYKTEMRH